MQSTEKIINGLSTQQAVALLARDGANELPSAKPRGVFDIALSVVSEPMFLLLIASATLYVLLGDTQQGMALLASVSGVIAITFFQEHKAERALEALRALSGPRVWVFRDGVRLKIPGRELVMGDTISLAEGDRVPADAALIDTISLMVDESLLTGESLPVNKTARTENHLPLPAEDGNQSLIYSGTLVVQGQCLAEVIAIGQATRIGRIGKSLLALQPELTRVQQETGRVVRLFALIGIAFCVLLALAYGWLRGDWLGGLLAGLTLAMAALPEELPIVLTIFLALGAWRISQRHVLTRRMPALEMLGATTVLCVDKTGTLTQNQMTLRKLFAGDSEHDFDSSSAPGSAPNLPRTFHPLLEYAALASQMTPFDPMEKAIHEAAAMLSPGDRPPLALAQDYPLSRELLAMSRVWRDPLRGDYVIAAKGAPEAIADLCHLDAPAAAQLSRQVQAWAAQGLRVLGVARASFHEDTLPALQHDFVFELLGLIAFADPLRADVPQAVRECHAAGIRLIMLTGDYPVTAQNIARQAGLRNHEEVMTGTQLAAMTDEALQAAIQRVNIFSRVQPEHKLRLVNALKARGEIVAMTGDGVNDAPALKAAHVGIAMGQRGTEVAREAAALVLENDDFSSIVAVIRAGRRIFDNLTKAVGFILAVHVPTIGLSVIPVLAGWPLVLLPIHIVFLEFIIDPVCTIVFEAEPDEPNVMQRPPRDARSRLFARQTTVLSLLQGGAILAAVLGVFYLSLVSGLAIEQARALTFFTLVLANLGLIFSLRAPSRPIWSALPIPNPALWWVSGVTLIAILLALNVPYLGGLFKFAPLSSQQYGLALSAAALAIILIESMKYFAARKS